MEFLPLKYAAGTVTRWHIGIWVLISLIPLMPVESARLEVMVGDIALAAVAFALLYLIMAPLIGQIYGDKFTWSQIWPSIFFVAFMLMAWGCLNLARTDPEFPASATLFFLTLGTIWFGLCLSLMMWLMPKSVAQWSPDQFPKKPWGVSL